MYSIGINTLNGMELCLFFNDKCVDFIKKSKNEIMVADEIIPQLQFLLEKNQITLQSISFLFVLVGPGYFTGIRIGVVVAKILQSSLQVPCIPINALDVMASQQLELNNKFNNLSNQDYYIFACCDIGKKGFVLTVYNSLAKELLSAKYYEGNIEPTVINSIIDKNLLSKVAPSKIIIVGEKQDICYEYLLKSVQNNINLVSDEIIANIILNKDIITPSKEAFYRLAYESYMQDKQLREIEAFYGNAVDISKPKSRS